jgi:type I restriction enzyme R subunit
MREDIVETAALGWFESLGYATLRGADISPGAQHPLRATYEEVLLMPRLKAALRRINPTMTEDAIVQAATELSRPPEPTVEQNNRWFHGLLTDGIPVEVRTTDGYPRGDYVRVVDRNQPWLNDWLVVQQMTVKIGEQTRRPDLIVYLNGLPISVIELKDPTNESADLWSAFNQLQDYRRTVPALFLYNEVMVISDGDQSRIGALTADRDRFTPWRSVADDRYPGAATLESVITSLFRPEAFIDYLQHCIVFEEQDGDGAIVKKIGGYHQLRAVRKARDSVKNALKPDGDGRGGVVWHTQGSGKSLTMLMLSAALITDPRLENPTIVVVTDRTDLDGQLFNTFARGRAILRQEPVQAVSREDLTDKLNRASGGVIFTTIQKFEEKEEPISTRSNIIVLADEAHRSQYGFLKGGARWVRENLPNATFVGFTGTPVESDDRSTRAVFGADVDIYDIMQAIEDNATVPIYYEMQLIKLLPDEIGIVTAEQWVADAAQADETGQTSEDVSIPLEELAGAQARLKVLAEQIVSHFEMRSEVIDGKGMIVCMSRDICMNLYHEVVALRPAWHDADDQRGVIKVVMDANPGRRRVGETQADYEQRVARIRLHGRTKARRDKLSDRIKNPLDPLQLVIVCDMWLTGFDCPPLHTMYLDKPLSGHNLMQAIARVNRVFGDKPGGVVVDYLGIADQLRDAIQMYTQAGGEGRPVERIQDQAVPLMRRHAEELMNFFHEFEYSYQLVSDEASQVSAIVNGVDYVFGRENGKNRFMDLVAKLSKTYALSVPRPETIAVRDHLAFYHNVRAAIRKRLADLSGEQSQRVPAAVHQIITGAIKTDGVIDLFEVAGLPDTNVGILSDTFLESIAALPQKNLALETLKKLLNDQVRSREKVNLVQAKGFRESLEVVLQRYASRAITTAQVIEELIGLAKTITAQISAGQITGLTENEIAFYEALADNASAKEMLADVTLRLIARELAESIRRKVSLDWTQRDTVRADMRRTVRRLLAKYDYPPDAQESATYLIIKQAELMAAGL